MTRVVASLKRHPALALSLPMLVVALAVGAWLMAGNLRVPEGGRAVAQDAPEAPRLTAGSPEQTVYRIDASRSSVTYEVEETLAGTSHTATGTTRGIAGDILRDAADPTRSTVGEIVVDVDQLTSDQSLRDNRLRHDFLQSMTFPLARLRSVSISGMPAKITDGQEYGLELSGELVVRDIAKPATLRATAIRTGDTLKVSARMTAKLSDYGIGPISLGPLVTSGNEAALVIELVAVREGAEPGSAELATGPGSSVADPGSGPSFKGVVQPILERNCASCHNPGRSGAQMWTLDTAADAVKAGSGLGLVTGSGYMPPWPASEVGVPLKHSRRLAAADVEAIAQWAAAGGPLDVDPTTKVAPATDNLEAQYAIRADRTMEYSSPYQGSTDKLNDYRCIALDPGLAADTFVTGLQFTPDQDSIVHHALAFKVSASRADEVRELDAASPGEGWPCYAGMSGPGGAQGLDGGNTGSELVNVWIPGQRPYKLPDGSGIPMAAGDQFVMQVHYHYGHGTPPDRSSLTLELSDRTDLDVVLTQTYLGPAEIPCSKDESGPLCDRDKVLERLNAEFGPAASGIANGLMLICGKNLDDFKDMTDGIATSSCDQRIRRDGEVLGVLGHEHEIGRTFRMTLNPGTPEEKILLDIPVWDFQWQMVFSPEERITVKKGDVLRIECSWDRSLLRTSEPMYVTWAEGTEDEMCYSALTLRLPKQS